MSDDASLLAPAFAAGIACSMIIFAWFWRRARRFSAPWIICRLQESRNPYETHVSFMDQTWNPTPGDGRRKLIGPGCPIIGPGTALYRLDDSGGVHLSFRTQSGGEQHFSGPLPATSEQPSFWHGVYGLARWVLLLDGFLLVGGAISGYLLSSGSIPTRLGGACVGLVLGGLATTVVSVIFMVSTSIRPAVGAQSVKPPGTGSGLDDPQDIWRQVEKNKQIAQRYLDEHEGPRPG